MGILIGMMGAGGVGKTTTAKAFAEKAGWNFAPSVSRSCFEAHGVKSEADQYNMTAEQKFALQTSIYEAKCKQDEEILGDPDSGNWVSDRTLFDQFGYQIIRCMESLSEDLFNARGSKVSHIMQGYYRVYYFPLITYPSHSDGMREDTFAPRYLHDCIMERCFRNLPDHQARIMPIGTVEERVKFIMDDLNLAS